MRRALAASAALAVLLGLLSGCAADEGGGPHFTLSRVGDGIADPVAIELSGLQPGANVTLSAVAHTVTGDWTSQAMYAVPADGRIQLWSQKPFVAPYVSPDPAALLWSMSGPPTGQQGLERTWALSGARIDFTAEQNGHPVAAATLHRGALSDGSEERRVTGADLLATGSPSAAGVAPAEQVGTFFVPQPSRGTPRPAVLIVDGDGDGASGAFAARWIAGTGYPVLDVPTVSPAGRIPGSSALDVQRLRAAVAWLGMRPGVDDGRIFVYGTGPSEPIALWFATHETGTVFGAIGASGPTALLCASADGAPSLTDSGLPVPCANPERSLADTPLLPLSSIPGPVLLACGASDQLLPAACAWTSAGLRERGPHRGDASLIAAGAAHEITAPPLLPIGLGGLAPSTRQATENARTGFWFWVNDLLEGAMRP